SYCADLALKRRDGTIVRLARSEQVLMPRAQPAIAISEHFMRVVETPARAEIVPPPARTDRPRAADTSRVKSINFARPPKAFDSSEVVRQKLEKLHNSFQSPSDQSPPEPSGAGVGAGPEGETAGSQREAPQSELANSSSVPPGERAFDLTDISETKFAD